MVSALGHNRQDESGVVSVSRSATGSCERLQRRGPSRGLYGESGLASLPSSHTNSSTTDRSFTLLLLPSLSPCILLCTFLHSITRTFRSFLFSAAPVLSFHHVVSQAAPLAALRAASCSQRCKQRNRADCGCQPVASSGTSTTWWRRTGSTFSTLLSMVRSGEAVCAMHLQLQLPLHPSLACMDGA